jgi:hypothetical protein
MLRRRMVGLCLILCACRGEEDPLAAPRAALSDLATLTARHRARLLRDLGARDTLGPGEYRTRLRKAYEDALTALALEHEARAADVLSVYAPVLRGDAGLALLEAGLPRPLGDLAADRGSAARHARRTAEASRALRERAQAAVAELRVLRERVLRLRAEIDRVRAEIGDKTTALLRAGGGSPADLLPLARRRRVRLTEVRRAADALTVRAEGRLRDLASFAGDIGERAGTDLLSIDVRMPSGIAGLEAKLLTRRPPPPADEREEPSSSPAVLESRLRDAEALRRSVAEAVVDDPGPAPLFSAIVADLGPDIRLTRFAAGDGRFALIAQGTEESARQLLTRLAAHPSIELVGPATSGGRVALRGFWRAGPIPVLAIRPERPVLPARRPQALTSLRLSGVVSNESGRVRALVEDESGRSQIVHVGSRLENGAEVAEIGKDYLLARLGGRLLRIGTR